MLDLAGLLVFARGLDRQTGAGAVDQYPLLTEGSPGFCKGGIDLCFLGDINLAEHAADFGSDGFAKCLVEIEDGNTYALGCKSARGCSAKSRRASGNDGGNR